MSGLEFFIVGLVVDENFFNNFGPRKIPKIPHNEEKINLLRAFLAGLTVESKLRKYMPKIIFGKFKKYEEIDSYIRHFYQEARGVRIIGYEKANTSIITTYGLGQFLQKSFFLQ